MALKKLTLRPNSLRDELRLYLLAFLLGFCSLLLVLLPIIIADKGYFIYYGDYNSQQIPFYNLANDAVRSGSFGWNWYTDLGANFIGSYAFYLLGSPFFWLSAALPRSWITFAMPGLLSLKHGAASVTAFAYIRRFVQNPYAAVIGGLLYAFSGFQLFNLFFNHFQDVTAFFPLMLIAMEENITRNRRGVFALSVALMGIINYFFFTGQAVFLVLYFIFRCFSKDFCVTPKKFFLLLLEAVIGVLIACGVMLPAALAILANSRVSEHLFGLDMVAYSDRTRIWRILLSMFMIPDVPARPNLFSSNTGKWASIGGYLPLFSMAGVLAFLKQRDGSWAKRLTVLCAVCACVPILNSAFYAFNGSYYARWFYMPVLILAMMTAYALDNGEIVWKQGMRLSFGILAAFGLISLLPEKDKDGNISWFTFANYPWHFYLVLAVAVGSLVLVIHLLLRRQKKKPFLRLGLIYSTAACVICTMTVVYFGAFDPSRARTYVDQAIDAEQEISVSVSQDDFFRVDISEDCDNYPMLWGLPCMRTFHSVVPASIMEFYNSVGITRDVASRAERSAYALRGLFSVKYYFDRTGLNLKSNTLGDTPSVDLPGFTYDITENGFHRFRNEAYIPMGFTFDSYIPEEEWQSLSENQRIPLLIRALVLTDDQIEAYGNDLEPVSDTDIRITEESYLTECEKRAASACDSFIYDSKGFTAAITTDSPKLVFFSVPYDEGWSAKVNNKPVEIEQVDVGFMAVPVENGSSEIVFSYETPGLRAGMILSLAGLVLLTGYLLICRKTTRRISKAEALSPIDYAASAEDLCIEQTEKESEEQADETEAPENQPEASDKPKTET